MVIQHSDPQSLWLGGLAGGRGTGLLEQWAGDTHMGTQLNLHNTHVHMHQPVARKS